MSTRRDKKGRILRTGETQLKSGEYEFRYTDLLGKRTTVRSWRLNETDPQPKNHKQKPALRTLEDEIERNRRLELVPTDLSVLELVDTYIKTRSGVSHNTEACYKTVRNILASKPFGSLPINKIKYSDAKLFLIRLQRDDGRSFSSIHSVRGVLRPAFQLAFEDELIRYNPFNFELGKLLVNDAIPREAVSPPDQKRFLEFLAAHKHYRAYYDGIYILFHTGLRVSELCGLTAEDVDFQRHTLSITKQLQRRRDGVYIIAPTKTRAGKRILPINTNVEQVLAHAISNRRRPKVEPVVDGVSGFIFLDNDGNPTNAYNWSHYFKYAVSAYNRTNTPKLPKITPHICRHTYCSNMARSGISPKTLQYLMGHSEIGVTMNVYTHLGLEAAEEELSALEHRKLM